MARKIKVNLTMDAELRERAQKEADSKGVSLSGYISFIIAEKLEVRESITVIGKMMEAMQKEADAQK